MCKRLNLFFYFLFFSIFLAACSVRKFPKSEMVGTFSDVKFDRKRSAKIRLELAINYYKYQQYHTALQEVELAIKFDPLLAEAYNLKALVYLSLKDQKRAKESFEIAVRLKPSDPDINNNFGWFLCSTGREEDSFGYFEKAISDVLYSSLNKTLANAGMCAFRIGKFDRAIYYLHRAFSGDPSNKNVELYLAKSFLDVGRYTDARFHITRLMKDPSPEIIWLNIKLAHLTKDDLQKRSLISQLEKFFPESNEYKLSQEGKYEN